MPAVPAEEVAQILRRIASGEVVVECIGMTWSDTYAGDVAFKADGWRLVIFNDCDEIDYVDAAIAPDGRESDFEDWCAELGGTTGPLDLLDANEISKLEQVLEKAQPMV